MQEKLKVGIIGATGMVGQRLITLLADHPWFEISCLAASPRSAGQEYGLLMVERWTQQQPVPEVVAQMTVLAADAIEQVAAKVDFVFCAVDMQKSAIRELEEAYAKAEVPVISNNSAHRWTDDVPMVIPEINVDHLRVIADQRRRLGTKRGFIAVKPNCSIQSYVPILAALQDYKPTEVKVCTYQAISGAGKTFESFPQILDNVIPRINGEEEKSEQEPLKIFGKVNQGKIVAADEPVISAQCLRVPVADGHMAAVSVSFEKKPTKEDFIQKLNDFVGEAQRLELPLAPKQMIYYLADEDRPQTKLDRDLERGMAITVGQLKEDRLFDYAFVGLSHNTLRGAAGGAVLIAELLKAKGYLTVN